LERITITYIICENCEGSYELQPEESLEDFESCKCIGILRYVDLNDYKLVQESETVRNIINNGNTYTEKMVSNYNNGIIAGAVMGLFGILGWFLGYKFLFILIFLGFLFSISSYNKSKSWIKGVKGEKLVSKYLNQLSKDYIILNDVTLPGRYGNIDHIL